MSADFDRPDFLLGQDVRQKGDPTFQANAPEGDPNKWGTVRHGTSSGYGAAASSGRTMQASHLRWLTETRRVLAPGAPIYSFSGSRTFHRLVAAMVEAGFSPGVDVLAWIYGSGFPKGGDLGKLIDKAARGVPQGGADPTSPNAGKYRTQRTDGSRGEGDRGQGYGAGPGQYMAKVGVRVDREFVHEAAAWAGWAPSLKPCWEPILRAYAPLPDGSFPPPTPTGLRVVHVLRKPLDGTLAACAQKWGTGSLHIGAVRVPRGSRDSLNGGTYSGGKRNATPGDTRSARAAGRYGEDGRLSPEDFVRPDGGVPANLLLVHLVGCRQIGTRKVPGGFVDIGADKGSGTPGGRVYGSADGTEEVPAWTCEPGCAVAALDRQAGRKKSGTGAVKRASSKDEYGNVGAALGAESRPAGTPMPCFGDEGSVSRYFNQLPAGPEAVLSNLYDLITPTHLPDCAIPHVRGVCIVDATALGTADDHWHGAVLQTPEGTDVGALRSIAAEALHVLRPGAHLMLLAPDDSPTGWLGACAFEDVGFEVRDAILIFGGAGVDAANLPAVYCAKAPASERAGLRSCPDCGWQEAMGAAELRKSQKAARAAGVEIPCPTCSASTKDEEHPTIKTVKVMRWLLRAAVADPNCGSGSILDPFAGTGSTLVAAQAEGIECIGIERDPRYVKITAYRTGVNPTPGIVPSAPSPQGDTVKGLPVAPSTTPPEPASAPPGEEAESAASASASPAGLLIGDALEQLRTLPDAAVVRDGVKAPSALAVEDVVVDVADDAPKSPNTGEATAVQTQLRPFWAYYGSKWRIAKHYPEPVHATIIEPFAGAAGYSLRYADRNVILIEKDPVVIGLWRYLLAVSPEEILALPNIAVDGSQTVDDLPICEEARHLVAWWCNKGTARPHKSPSKWMRRAHAGGYSTGGSAPSNWWGPEIRQRIASQLPAIRHWQIIEGSYEDAPDIEATWFVDPPYQTQGKYYRHGAKDIGFAALGAWCRERRGQVVVCEQEGADWLPFRFFRDVKAGEGTHGRKRSREVIWTKGCGEAPDAPLPRPAPAPPPASPPSAPDHGAAEGHPPDPGAAPDPGSGEPGVDAGGHGSGAGPRPGGGADEGGPDRAVRLLQAAVVPAGSARGDSEEDPAGGLSAVVERGAIRLLSVCSGLGGLDLGLHRAGFRAVAFVEHDPFCQRVLARHWPDVSQAHHDLVALSRDPAALAALPDFDVLAGGIPCQEVSSAGKRKGTAGDRWLWPHFAAILAARRPAAALVENVRGLLSAQSGWAFASILRGAADLGYQTEWEMLATGTLGAPHRRERMFLIFTRVGIAPLGGRGAYGIAWPRGKGDEVVRGLDGRSAKSAGKGRGNPWAFRWPVAGRFAPDPTRSREWTVSSRVPLWPTPGTGKSPWEWAADQEEIDAWVAVGLDGPTGAATRIATGSRGSSPVRVALPTPRCAEASFYAEDPETLAARGGDGRDTLATAALRRALPTPSASLPNDNEDPEQWEARRKVLAVRHGNNGAGTPLAVEAKRRALPTPQAYSHGDSNPPGTTTLDRVVRGMTEGGDRPLRQALPTPRVSADRASRGSMVLTPQWSAPSLAQAVELKSGVLPREFHDESELTPGARRMWEEGMRRRALPTPTSTDAADRDYQISGGRDFPTLGHAAKTAAGVESQMVRRALPTPLATDGYKEPTGSLARQIHTGAPDGRLDGAARRHALPTPQAHDAQGEPGAGSRAAGGRQGDLPSRIRVALPTPTARGGEGGEMGSDRARAGGPDLRAEAHRRALPTPAARDYRDPGADRSDSPHAQPLPQAIRDRGIVGRLSPALPEWMMGLPGTAGGWSHPDGPSLLDAPSRPYLPDLTAELALTPEKEHRRPRLRAIGNAVSTHVAEVIGEGLRRAVEAGRRALEADAAREADRAFLLDSSRTTASRQGVRPICKWPGGKRQILPQLVAAAARQAPPSGFTSYIEPLCGGAATYLAVREAGLLAPNCRVVLGDASEELIACYRAVQSDPAGVLASLWNLLDEYEAAVLVEGLAGGEAVYLRVRSGGMGAADFLFINRAGFNGLWRVNATGACNVPFGKRECPIRDRQAFAANLRAFAAALAGVELVVGDFADL